MLTALSIRDIVLVEALDLEFGGGLAVLTGETGAGKSIMLDSLGLVLGQRADAGLVRQGAAQGVVSASFDIAARSEEHTSELQSLMRISYAVFCLKKNTQHIHTYHIIHLSTYDT